MKKIFVFLSLAICCLCVSAQKISWATYSNENYSFNYPVNWNQEELTEAYISGGMQVMFMSPADKPNDKFFENMNVVVDKKKAPITLAQYLSALKTYFPNLIDKFKLKTSSIKTNAQGEYACLEYTGELSGNKVAWMQSIWIKNLNVYILSYSATPSSYKKYKGIFTGINDSFRIKAEY